MKLDDIDSIEQILRAFVEETHQRDKEDRELYENLKTFLLRQQPVNEPRGLREAIYFLRWSLDTNTPIDRSCLDKETGDDSEIDSASPNFENSGNSEF